MNVACKSNAFLSKGDLLSPAVPARSNKKPVTVVNLDTTQKVIR
jgi:hypothetical protein